MLVQILPRHRAIQSECTGPTNNVFQCTKPTALKTLLRQKNCVSEGHTLKQMNAPLRSTQYNPSVQVQQTMSFHARSQLRLKPCFGKRIVFLRDTSCVTQEAQRGGHTSL